MTHRPVNQCEDVDPYLVLALILTRPDRIIVFGRRSICFALLLALMACSLNAMACSADMLMFGSLNALVATVATALRQPSLHTEITR